MAKDNRTHSHVSAKRLLVLKIHGCHGESYRMNFSEHTAPTKAWSAPRPPRPRRRGHGYGRGRRSFTPSTGTPPERRFGSGLCGFGWRFLRGDPFNNQLQLPPRIHHNPKHVIARARFIGSTCSLEVYNLATCNKCFWQLKTCSWAH